MSRRLLAAMAVALFAVLLVLPAASVAAPALSDLTRVTQPDGSIIWVRQFGNEWVNGVRTQDGYTIVLDQGTGFWVYGEEAPGGGIQPSGLIVGRDQPFGIPQRLVPRAAARAALRGPAASKVAPAAVSNLGSQPVLVIFVDFTPSIAVGSTPASLAGKFFGATSSVKHYYEETSYGNFTLGPAEETDTALDGSADDGIVSVTLDYPHPITAGTIDDRNQQITKDALIAADPFVDFAAFDTDADGVISPTELHIVVIVAGYERSFSASPCGASVWGHRWGLFGAVPPPVLDGKTVGVNYMQFGEWHCHSLNPPGHEATIGIMAHELGHDLSLPDLYDIDGSSEGIGKWGIMGAGSWNGVTLPGDSPAHMDPWSKWFQGWIMPTVVTGQLVDQPILEASANPDVYQLLSGTPSSGEYFLVENRQRTGYDAGLPGAGLLIWHIDASINPSDNTENSRECYPGGPSCAVEHYKVAVVQADNLYDLDIGNDPGDAGDPWPGSTGKTTFSGASSPRSHRYNGSVSDVGVTNISASGPTMTATLSTTAAVPTPPPAPTLVSPNATITDNTPTYIWNAVATATWYRLDVTRPSGIVYALWYTSAQAGCPAGTGTCSVTPTNVLPNAAYTWRVLGWNPIGFGPLSTPMAFTVNAPVPTPPPAPTLVSPNATITDNTPTHIWNAVATATWYRLDVTRPSGIVYALWYTSAQAGCPAGTGTCSVTPTNVLPNAAYTWRVLGWNPIGFGPLSTPMAFTVNAPVPTPPPAPTLVSPNATITDNTPTYIWNAVATATWYRLDVTRPSGIVYALWYTSAQAGCPAGTGTCSVTPTNVLPNAAYTWRVLGWNPIGFGPLSTPMAFTVNAPVPTPPPAPTLVSPNATITDNTPTYIWNAVATATWYRLDVTRPSGIVYALWYTSAQAGCPAGTGTCSVTPPNLLPGAAYTWRVLGWNPIGFGPLSTPMAFTVNAPGVPVRFFNDLCFSPGCTPFTAYLTASEGYTWQSFTGVVSPYQQVVHSSLSNFTAYIPGFSPIFFSGSFTLTPDRRHVLVLTVDATGLILFLFDDGPEASVALQPALHPGVPLAVIRVAPQSGTPLPVGPAGAWPRAR